MPKGICKLCLSEQDLQLSHLMPRSLYKKLRSRGKGNNDPCVVTARTFRRSSGQYTDYVFCKKCEDRFNVGGENYVMRVLPNESGFPLLEILDSAKPSRAKDDWRAYTAVETPSIDRTELAYFALSIFWRASIHRWTLKGHAPVEIDLGKRYSEALRRYLLGEAPAPTEANLSVCVCTDMMSRKVMNPPSPHVANGLRSFGLLTCGVDFDLCISKTAPSWARHLSVLRKPDQIIVSYDPKKHQRWYINATADDQAALRRSMESFGKR